MEVEVFLKPSSYIINLYLIVFSPHTNYFLREEEN